MLCDAYSVWQYVCVSLIYDLFVSSVVAYDVNVWKTKNLSQYYHDDVVHESHYADILYKTLISTRAGVNILF